MIWFFVCFLCISYHCDFLNFSISYLFRPTRLSYYSSKLYNVWEKDFSNPAKLSSSGGIFAGAGFGKCWIPAGSEIRYSSSGNMYKWYRAVSYTLSNLYKRCPETNEHCFLTQMLETLSQSEWKKNKRYRHFLNWVPWGYTGWAKKLYI